MAGKTSVERCSRLALEVDVVCFELSNYHYLMWFSLTHQMPSENFRFLAARCLIEIEKSINKLNSVVVSELSEREMLSE